jgi:hypothetical protein
MSVTTLRVSSIDLAPAPLSAVALLARISTPGHRHEASVHPPDAGFPRFGIEHHRRAGYSILCHEDESPIGFLAALGRPLSAPAVAVNLGAQVSERRPPELFLRGAAALRVVLHFFATGRQHPGFAWVRPDRSVRLHVREGAGLLDVWDALTWRGEA